MVRSRKTGRMRRSCARTGSTRRYGGRLSRSTPPQTCRSMLRSSVPPMDEQGVRVLVIEHLTGDVLETYAADIRAADRCCAIGATDSEAAVRALVDHKWTLGDAQFYEALEIELAKLTMEISSWQRWKTTGLSRDERCCLAQGLESRFRPAVTARALVKRAATELGVREEHV